MHTHTYIQITSRVATSVLSGRLVLAKVQADQKKRIITGSEYSSPPPSQTRFCRKATPLACKRNTLDKKTSLNISFGTGGSIISGFRAKFQKRVTSVAFQSNLRKQIRKLPKILKFVKIIQYYSILFIRVLSCKCWCLREPSLVDNVQETRLAAVERA